MTQIKGKPLTLDALRAYTRGREPLVTVNTLAALLLGLVVKLAADLGFQWDEFSLTLAGAFTVAAATWLARKGVWSPASVVKAQRKAYDVGVAEADVVRRVRADRIEPRPVVRTQAIPAPHPSPAADEDGDGR